MELGIEKAETGLVEKTLETKFYDFTRGFEEELEMTDYDNLFFVDQPGIGGAKINRKRIPCISRD